MKQLELSVTYATDANLLDGGQLVFTEDHTDREILKYFQKILLHAVAQKFPCYEVSVAIFEKKHPSPGDPRLSITPIVAPPVDDEERLRIYKGVLYCLHRTGLTDCFDGRVHLEDVTVDHEERG